MPTFDEGIAALRAEDPDRDYVVISAPITRQLHIQLSMALATFKKHDALTIFLTTLGGDPDGAYRIGRCLRHHYKTVRIAIPSWCKSAGTLIAIAADELAVGDFGELGPLDIQVYKGSELQERSSGLDITEALGAVTSHTRETFHEMLKETRNLGLSTKLSAEFAAQVSTAVAAPLFTQIDPIRLGELQRLTRIAGEYGKRLDAYKKNLKDGALDRLILEYPSHSFVIDRKEAKELFHRVSPMTIAEDTFSNAIWHITSTQVDLPPQFVDINSTEEDGEGTENEQPPTEDSQSGLDAGTGSVLSSRRRPGTGAEGVSIRASGDETPPASGADPSTA